MNRIHLLSASVANQIAAGEVIERPASVVKELLENALDAGASVINIDIGFGGLNQVKVSDNGIGVFADDLPLAIAAHATSKISKLNDLYAINSMGFRGEALASIASISRLSIISKPAEQAHAMMMQVEGETMRLSPCARNQGTTIDVRDLFFNAPVRKKFLKTERSEYQAIDAVVKRFALSAPAVALTIKHNDKTTLVLPAAACEQTQLLRIKKLLGSTFVNQAIYLDVERAGMRLHGWISGQDYQRSQHDKQWIYLNRRMVKDKLLNHALKQAYEGVLHLGRHPSCVLYLTIPPNQVDVNVHPTKHEVRFQQPRLVHDLMTSQILAALRNETGVTERVHTEKTQNWAVREVHVDYPSLTTSVIPQWHSLNTHFAIVYLHNEPWFCNVETLHHHRLKAVLSLPLASRPLLVPVSVVIAKENYSFMEQRRSLLEELGLQCDFASDTRLMVRTIPRLLPSLDIQQFFGSMDSTMELLTHLIMCQSFDARHLSVEDKIDLTTYLQKIPEKFGLKLDVTTCRGFLDA